MFSIFSICVLWVLGDHLIPNTCNPCLPTHLYPGQTVNGLDSDQTHLYPGPNLSRTQELKAKQGASVQHRPQCLDQALPICELCRPGTACLHPDLDLGFETKLESIKRRLEESQKPFFMCCFTVCACMCGFLLLRDTSYSSRFQHLDQQSHSADQLTRGRTSSAVQIYPSNLRQINGQVNITERK